MSNCSLIMLAKCARSYSTTSTPTPSAIKSRLSLDAGHSDRIYAAGIDHRKRATLSSPLCNSHFLWAIIPECVCYLRHSNNLLDNTIYFAIPSLYGVEAQLTFRPYNSDEYPCVLLESLHNHEIRCAFFAAKSLRISLAQHQSKYATSNGPKRCGGTVS
ncbi:hypothetical protein PsYK624_108700 [Phanerochaete sordida]|uniref:Uncharacterized protein n=1 Tax=Phanerochaete sordida TaxID=48140 RepID=A0A9P3GJH7_9APHY|nr:hypothetical protein PsYK624_108700 [Phanerochaete sordida]